MSPTTALIGVICLGALWVYLFVRWINRREEWATICLGVLSFLFLYGLIVRVLALYLIPSWN